MILGYHLRLCNINIEAGHKYIFIGSPIYFVAESLKSMQTGIRLYAYVRREKIEGFSKCCAHNAFSLVVWPKKGRRKLTIRYENANCFRLGLTAVKAKTIDFYGKIVSF